MSLKFSCGAKTFLLGEYAVLNGGHALLMNTNPRFELKVNERGSGTVQGIHPESPAGQWIRRHRQHFDKVDVQFVDPYFGIGGVGASSAQFLMVYELAQHLQSLGLQPQGTVKNVDTSAEDVWRAYRLSESVSSEGLRPSGADLVSQHLGGFCVFQSEPFEAQSMKWDTEEFSVALIPTEKKLATHEHLRGLKKVETDELEWISREGVSAFVSGQFERFFDCVRDYHAELLEMGLVADHTKDYVAAFLSKPYVAAAKGSGAMGSDVLAVYYRNENAALVDALVTEMGLKIAATQSNVAGKFSYDYAPSFKMSCLPPVKAPTSEPKP